MYTSNNKCGLCFYLLLFTLFFETDSSTPCNNDFQWFRKKSSTSPSKMEETETLLANRPPLGKSISREKPLRRDKTAPGSLDRRRHHSNRAERDQKSKSTNLLKSPPRLEDFTTCQNWCCSPHDFCFEHFRKRHERLDPQKYGSNPILEQRPYQNCMAGGSHPDIYNEYGRYRHDYQCYSFQMGPPPYCFNADRTCHYFQAPYLKVSVGLSSTKY